MGSYIASSGDKANLECTVTTAVIWEMKLESNAFNVQFHRHADINLRTPCQLDWQIPLSSCVSWCYRTRPMNGMKERFFGRNNETFVGRGTCRGVSNDEANS